LLDACRRCLASYYDFFFWPHPPAHVRIVGDHAGGYAEGSAGATRLFLPGMTMR